MRTTLSIDDDVLLAVQELARRTKTSAGRVLSDLARQSLSRVGQSSGSTSQTRHGFTPIPRRGAGVVTNELINSLREDGPY